MDHPNTAYQLLLLGALSLIYGSAVRRYRNLLDLRKHMYVLVVFCD
jgi:hypothetical protein